MQVIQALQFYEKLVQQHSVTTYYRGVLRNGIHAENLKLWKPICAILRFCGEKHISVFHFLQAQFVEWVKPTPYATTYPTWRYLGVNAGCVSRYKAWLRRVQMSQGARCPENILKSGEATLKNIMVSRVDMKTISDVLLDPFLVRLLPRDYVWSLPEFRQLAPTLSSDPAMSAVLADYLQ